MRLRASGAVESRPLMGTSPKYRAGSGAGPWAPAGTREGPPAHLFSTPRPPPPLPLPSHTSLTLPCRPSSPCLQLCVHASGRR